MANRTRRVLAGLAAVVATLFMAPTAAHADEIRDNQWHLSYLKAPELHAITRGEGVTVAVIDSGVDGNHPDLEGNVLAGKDFTNSSGPQPWLDQRGHGTGMASLIAGHGHGTNHDDGVLGLAPAAKILPIKATGVYGDNQHISDGIRWAVDNNANVINLSTGNKIDSPEIRKALDYAFENDVVVIAGAGNTTQGHDKVLDPARYPGVIATSGVNRSGKFAGQSVSGPEIVLAAPAVDIQAAGSGERDQYYVGTGTSDATAIVSGIVALIRAKYPDLDAANVINRLITTATDEGEKGRDPKYGYGVVNPLGALTKDVPEVDHNPLLPEPPDTPRSEAASTRDDESAPVGPIIAIAGAAVALLILVPGITLAIRNNRRTRRHQPPPPAWPGHPPPPPPPFRH